MVRREKIAQKPHELKKKRGGKKETPDEHYTSQMGTEGGWAISRKGSFEGTLGKWENRKVWVCRRKVNSRGRTERSLSLHSMRDNRSRAERSVTGVGVCTFQVCKAFKLPSVVKIPHSKDLPDAKSPLTAFAQSGGGERRINIELAA